MIYLSSCMLPRTFHLPTAILRAVEQGYYNFELSSCHRFHNNNFLFHLTYHQVSFILHNYFPVKFTMPFLLNLASTNYSELEQSRQHVIDCLYLSKKLQTPFYSVHAGFRASGIVSEQGIRFSKILTPYDEAYEIFIDSIKILSKKAKQLDVILAIENNTPINMNANVFQYVLLSAPEELESFMCDYHSDYLKLLLDVGHFNVASTLYNCNRFHEALNLMPFTIATHLHENDGKSDTHRNIHENSWFLPLLHSSLYVILEAYNQSWVEIAKAYRIIRNQVNVK